MADIASRLVGVWVSFVTKFEQAACGFRGSAGEYWSEMKIYGRTLSWEAEVDKRLTTLWRMAQEPDFKRRLLEARGRLSEQIVISLQANTLDAVNTLRSIMRDKRTPASVRVSAASRLIEVSLRAKNQLDLEHRLADLETGVEASKERKKWHWKIASSFLANTNAYAYFCALYRAVTIKRLEQSLRQVHAWIRK